MFHEINIIGAIAIAIIVVIATLSLFFRALAWFTAGESEAVAIRGVLSKETYVSMHMTGSESYDRVRFVGFTNTDSSKTHLPYELNGMVILEDEQHQKFIVRAKNIRMIVVPPEKAKSSQPASN